MAGESFFEKVEQIKMPARIVILVVTLCLFIGIFYMLVYSPKKQEIAKTRNEIAGLKVRLTRAEAKARNYEKFRAEKVEVTAQFQEALKLLPNKKEIPSLLRNITQLGSDSQLQFRLFSPQKEKEKDFYMEIPVSIEVSGNYHNVAIFFDKVGRMARIVNILNVSMRPVKERSTNLVTKCNAVTYRFKAGSNGKATKENTK